MIFPETSILSNKFGAAVISLLFFWQMTVAIVNAVLVEKADTISGFRQISYVVSFMAFPSMQMMSAVSSTVSL